LTIFHFQRHSNITLSNIKLEAREISRKVVEMRKSEVCAEHKVYREKKKKTDVRNRTVPGTVRREATANLLSAILSLCLFHYILGTRFNFNTRYVCRFPDHH
jgi:hypothetical protein